MKILLNNYWENRVEEHLKSSYKDTKEFIKFLNYIFGRTQSKIERDIIAKLEKLADGEELSITELKKRLNAKELREYKMSLTEYINKAKRESLDDTTIKELEAASNLYHISKLQAIEEEIKAEVSSLYSEYKNKVSEALSRAFEYKFYKTAYDVQTLTGYSHIAKLNNKVIERILSKPWAPDGRSFSNRIWQDRTKLVNELHKELSHGVILGESPSKVANRLSKRMDVSRKRAYRLVHTEMAHAYEEATAESYRDRNIKEYQILATLDLKTSQICRDMDKKIFKLSEKKVGINYPPFHCYCRTTTIPHVKNLKGNRIARDPVTGKNMYMNTGMKYENWYKKYVR